MRRYIFVSLFLLAAGLTISSAAIFAVALGLDQGAGWGRARIALLALGFFILLCAASYYFFTDKVASAERKIWSFFEKYLQENKPLARLAKYRFALPFVAAPLLIYVWLISSGAWTQWVSPTHYYANLANGFEKGNLYTASKPPAQLSALSDPYDSKIRDKAGIDTPIDISYYKGRYYLYWGPVPALLLVAFSPFYSGRMGDLQLVFVFVSGIFLIQVFFVIQLWDRFFRNLPKWILPVSILVIGLSSPVTYMLDNFSGARIYEASVSGAQFFLLGGFLIAFACWNDLRAWKLALAGFLWAFAIGTRQTVFLAVGFMALMLAYVVLKSDKTFFQKIKEMSALILPLVMGVGCLGWYNWARFGSVTETGLYYQMNRGFVHYHTDKLIGFRYVFQNLYNYLIMPFGVDSKFPFLYPQFGNREEVLFSFSAPSIYGSQLITGLLLAVPFIVFALVPFAVLLFKKGLTQNDEQRLFNWTTTTLGGAALASFSFLLIFFWAAMRYADDFMPSLILLSVIGFWQGYALLLDKPAARRLYAALGIILASVSIIISSLLALSINDARFLFTGMP